MEKSVKKIIQKSGGSKDRVDIKYRQTGSAHVIVELKRAGRRVSTAELAGQIRKYYGPVTDHVRGGAEGQQTEVQVVCVLGKDPVDWQDYDGRSISREMLRPLQRTDRHLRRAHHACPAELFRLPQGPQEAGTSPQHDRQHRVADH